MAEPDHVKSELEGASPMAVDDDIYEDAGDLEFYDSAFPNDPYGSMYLVRIPPYVWEAWEHLDDNAEINIGTIRQWNETNRKGEQKVTIPLPPKRAPSWSHLRCWRVLY
jgi:transcription initiation factor TFIIF subunit beta